ncbi:MAG: DUF3552 domain-containing protein, partial [Bacteroidales bacterium]|nr:DUF3552 domain-containing protein [Bacteroidales bacterium]
MNIATILAAIVGLIVGAAIALCIWTLVLKKTHKKALANAAKEGEMLKEKKILEAKERVSRMQSEMDRQANQRNQKLQQAEQHIRQQQQQVQQLQQSLDSRIADNDRTREQLQRQIELTEQKSHELDARITESRKMLEQVAGLSVEEAKQKLVESLKDEARTEAASYVNEIMDDARMTANKEAKSIVIKTIQRVASETAVENAVTVFHIDSDEVKGRIIGREGRNI